ncbi:putative aspartic-type endopeptidase OPSB 6 [Colletotrichum chlorophyti]|uniref:Putative aspartic-type endopeptidase OPSB 6 n=1 Tax=Colletotrichum chlorophyti TaxID=708187 RepID=A0A1Q8RPY8_9PEZI|nr:putative aspartic-type endopeptidase OPSB 6 [Colletotrichum chlorophyti]
MRTSALCAAAVCAVTASAELVRLPFTRQSASAHPSPTTSSYYSSSTGYSYGSRTKSSVTVVNFHQPQWNFGVNVTIGTPPQKVSMVIDVQSDQSWVFDAFSCREYVDYYYYNYNYNYDSTPCMDRSFRGNESSTYVNPGTQSFEARYTEHGSLTGQMMSETLNLAGMELPKFVMGLAKSADGYDGVLGLGFNSSTARSTSLTYSPSSTGSIATLPDRLFKDGNISSTAYSLSFDDDSANSGSILFGAIDKSKYNGPLIRFPVKTSSDSGYYYNANKRFTTIIDSVNASKSSTDSLQPISNRYQDRSYYYSSPSGYTVQLNPHSPLSVLPDEMVIDIWALAGASWNEVISYAIIPCKSASSLTGSIAMQIHGPDGPVLKVPMRDLVVSKDIWVTSEWSWDTEKSEDYCLFGVQSDNSTRATRAYTYSLGIGMLKQSYMVFDTANAEIAIAAASFDATANEEIVPFADYAAKTPESTAAKDTDCSGYSSSSGCEDSSSRSGSGSGGYWTPGLSNAAKVGIGLGVGGGAFVVLCLSIWAIRRCRRKRKARAELAEKRGDPEDASATESGGADQDGGGGGSGHNQEGSPPQQPTAAGTTQPNIPVSSPTRQEDAESVTTIVADRPEGRNAA